MILRFIALVVLLLYLPAAAANISITVLPFSQKGSQSHSWIGTAIADLLMQNLVELSSVHVLDRDMLQSYLKELEFQQSGFVSNKTTQRLGRIARVDQVIHGYYKVSEQNQIEVTLQVTQTDSQSVVRLESIAGDIAKINELIELLTLNYLHNHLLNIK